MLEFVDRGCRPAERLLSRDVWGPKKLTIVRGCGPGRFVSCVQNCEFVTDRVPGRGEIGQLVAHGVACGPRLGEPQLPGIRRARKGWCHRCGQPGRDRPAT